MAGRFNPLTALEGSFLGFPFKIAREHGEGGRRGPLHQYPDRDTPYFEDLGREAKRFELTVYFIGATCDLTAQLFDDLLQRGQQGSLVLPGLRRERMVAQKWSYEREAGKGNWVQFQVTFVEPGGNTYPSAAVSLPHQLVDLALEARTAFADALEQGLSLAGLTQEATEQLAVAAGGLALALNASAQIASGLAPSSAIAAAGLLAGGFAHTWGGPAIDTALFAVATVTLVAQWSDTLAGNPVSNDSRLRAVQGLFSVYDQATAPFWYVPGAQTPLQSAEVANQAAFSAGVRRASLAEAARLAASLDFSSYDDAAQLRERFADAFDEEVSAAYLEPKTRTLLEDLGATTLQAISAAGADKAKLVTYQINRPRPALVLAQLWYADDADVPGRAAELTARTGAIHPAFLPATGERLSS